MVKGHPFAMLLSDLEAVKRLQIGSARADHEAILTPEGELESDVLKIDLAPLLGMEPAPHRVITLGDLNAVQFFQLSEANEKLWRRQKVMGWPQSLCRDVAMLCTMHKSPNYEESGKSLFDFYGTLAGGSPRLRGLYLYLLERVARAFPDLVRPEVRLEILYNDMRFDALMRGEEPPSLEEEQYAKGAEALAVLPEPEQSPNDSAGSSEERSDDTRLNLETSPLASTDNGTGH